MNGMKYPWLLDLQVFYRRLNLDGSLNHDDTQYTYTFLMVWTKEYKPEDNLWRMYIHSLCQEKLNEKLGNFVITYILCIGASDLSVLQFDPVERPHFHTDYLYDINFDCHDLFEFSLLEEFTIVE